MGVQKTSGTYDLYEQSVLLLVLVLLLIFCASITVYSLYNKAEEWTCRPYKSNSPVLKKPRVLTLITMVFLIGALLSKLI